MSGSRPSSRLRLKRGGDTLGQSNACWECTVDVRYVAGVPLQHPTPLRHVSLSGASYQIEAVSTQVASKRTRLVTRYSSVRVTMPYTYEDSSDSRTLTRRGRWDLKAFEGCVRWPGDRHPTSLSRSLRLRKAAQT